MPQPPQLSQYFPRNPTFLMIEHGADLSTMQDQIVGNMNSH